MLAGGAVALVCLAVGAWLIADARLFRKTTAPSELPAISAPPVEDRLACTKSLPSAVKIGQKIMVAGYSDQLVESAPVLAEAGVGGVILMDEMLAEAISTFRAAFTISPTIGVDQEGGSVQRYKSEGELPGATMMAASNSPEEAYKLYLQDATYLKSFGITTNFAPVLDVASREPNPLPGRMYSSDPATVTKYSLAAIRAAGTAGITPVLKHFPGLGSATGNTDFGSATTDPLATLKTRYLLPYRNVALLKPDVMVSHAVVPDLTEGKPASVSKEALSLLRKYGYQNSVVYTDSLTAAAIAASPEDAALEAWQAGVDVALFVQDRSTPADLSSYVRSIIDKAVEAEKTGTLNSDELAASTLRILNRKDINPCKLTSASP